MDFDQTCIDTWLGGGKELVDFGDLENEVTKTDQIRFSDATSSEQMNGF